MTARGGEPEEPAREPGEAEGGAGEAARGGRHRSRARWRRRRPLRTRMALAATAAVAVVAVGMCVAAFLIVRAQLEHQLQLNLTQYARLVAQRNHGAGPGVLSGECRFLAAPGCAQVVPADRRDDPPDPYILPVTDTARAVAAGRHGPYYSEITVAGRPTRMLTTDFAPGRALQVAIRSDTVERGVDQVARLLTLTCAIGVVTAGFLGSWVARTGLAPVTRLTATAERIAATRDPRHRIGPASPGPGAAPADEITRLAASFDVMLDELEKSVTARRRLVADASHELRTPLTALRTNAELLTRADRLTPRQRDRAASAVHRLLREVNGLVADLIELARDEEPRPLLEQVALAPLLAHTVATARDHWPAVPFEVRVTGAPVVPGVPARLTRLVGNLLDNAAKFSPPGQPVEITLDAHELTVRDHGPGIAEEDLPYVFDRFYRATAARALPGSGLGLAMALQIARAHGAELTAERAPGGGALFRLTFPG